MQTVQVDLSHSVDISARFKSSFSWVVNVILHTMQKQPSCKTLKSLGKKIVKSKVAAKK